MIDRRAFLRYGGLAASVPFVFHPATAAETLPPWSPGVMEIHHISTGRGNCAFLLCPDATTMMVDAGALLSKPELAFYLVEPKPDASRRPGEWIARYVTRRLAGIRPPAIDTFIATHFHADHIGECGPESPRSRFGDYRLTGVTGLAESIPLKRIIDRGFPDYAYPAPLTDATQINYRAFLRSWTARGGVAERLKPGSGEQLALTREPAAWPAFGVRNIAANGEVWTGTGTTTRHQFPALTALPPEQYPSENMCSIALRFSYGAFDYFTSGDMTNCTNYGRDPWRDIETPAALAAGPVDVALVSHHGYIDATGPGFVSALRPRVFIVPAWNAAHPTMPARYNMLSRDLYPGNRDIFSTAIKPESKVAVRRLAEMRSDHGHVVVLVEKGGGLYSVYIVANDDESGRVTAKFGPYLSE
jgi:hypothetical protein